jgi:hypothetical protein
MTRSSIEKKKQKGIKRQNKGQGFKVQDSNQELVDQNGEREANNHSKSLYGSIEECHDLNLRHRL